MIRRRGFFCFSPSVARGCFWVTGRGKGYVLDADDGCSRAEVARW